ncbi:hypothetical protein [uncultured Kordia sp.]|uniref:hypothetical protein n=1 Tax=uncultured Kordia sp. TaxID=507699 RepID=UPI0026346C30|nr:hypothetical protein [uncultured Kordia sp.]
MKKVLVIIGLITLFRPESSVKTIPISVKAVFESITDISEIKVLGYVNDSVMTYVDFKKQDTLQLDCKWKKYSEDFFNIMKDRDPNYNSWEGTFPKIGETITMLTYEHGRNRILFARELDTHYRFWDPRSIPFSNSVFFIAKKGIYKPTEVCENSYQTATEFHCPDGFLISIKEFEKVKRKTEIYSYFNFQKSERP